MNAQPLEAVANADTPQHVQLPAGMAGVVIWLAGRFGVGILVAGVFGWGLREVYSDNKALQGQMLNAFQEQSRVNAATLAALEQFKQEFRDAHSRAGTKPNTKESP